MSDAPDGQAPPLPHAHAVTWGVAALPHRGPKRELSTERIVEAAIEIADADGLDAVSMGRVAAAVGFTPMSLYRYVTGKDDLLLLMYDAASEIAMPSTGEGWRERLRDWAVFVRASYDAHPWLADLPPSSTPTTPNRLAVVEAGFIALEEVDAPDRMKLATLLLLLGYIGLYARASSDAGVDDAVRAALPELVTDERFPALAPAVRAGLFEEPVAEPESGFRFGLSRLLDGIERWIERAGADGDDIGRLPASIVADKQVREAAKVVDEARARLRQAEAKAAEAVARASERLEAVEAKDRAADAKAAAKAEAKADQRAKAEAKEQAKADAKAERARRKEPSSR
ncbi:TetR/AcrR family transcriptional regulator [Agrococcus terreus]|uniref:HTH tetR-type domain-containing protein n=1 Tax=Agrococcus terreus TaxID=574649 RepID=A0ABQ2KEC9_9MICO|nr:TetR/AcrR family transcriptional regulator [Agrococcus terreus]GGN79959.1 hypothetical protein GCM10010968_07400 [Agrococcus terreus]